MSRICRLRRALEQRPLLADTVEKAVKYSVGPEARIFGEGSEGFCRHLLGRHAGRYAASISGSIFSGQ
jgi:hypothetical protein